METKVIDNREDSRSEVPQEVEFLKDWNPDDAYGARKGERVALVRKEFSARDVAPLVKAGFARYVNGGPNGPVADEKSEGVLVRDCPFGRAGDQLKACALGAEELRFAVRKGWARVEDKAVQEATLESAPPRPKIKKEDFPIFLYAVAQRASLYLLKHFNSVFSRPSSIHKGNKPHNERANWPAGTEERFKAAMAGTSGVTGGYTVPIEFYDEMLLAGLETARIKPNAYVFPRHSRILQVPYLDITTAQTAGTSPFAGGMKLVYTPEGASRTETEPQFKQLELTAWELSGYAVVSRPLYDDSPALQKYLYTIFGNAIIAGEEYSFLQGNGVGQPLGIINAPASSVVTRVVANQIQYADVSSMLAALLPASASRAFFLYNPSAVPQLLQLKDGANRSVTLTAETCPDLKPGEMRVAGHYAYPSSHLPTLGSKGDLVLVDPAFYAIGTHEMGGSGLEIAASGDVNFLKNQITYRLVRRQDGSPWIDKPLTIDDGATTVSPFVVLN